MATFTRRVTWGRGLFDEVHRSGGLPRATKRIQEAVGPLAGSRNTFAKLFDLDAPPAEGIDAIRAWLLLTVIGQDPEDWGVPPSVLPAATPAEVVSDLLKRSYAWNTAGEDLPESWFHSAVSGAELLVASP